MPYLDALAPLRAWLTRSPRRSGHRPPPRFRPTVLQLEERAVPSVNQPPTFDTIPNQTYNENAAPQTITITGIAPGPLPAEQSQAIDIHVASDSSGVIQAFQFGSFSPSNSYPTTIPLTITLTPNFSGIAHVTVTLHDDGGTAGGGHDTTMQTFSVTVIPTPPPPTPQVSLVGFKFLPNRRRPLSSKLELTFLGSINIEPGAFQLKIGKLNFKVNVVTTPSGNETIVDLSLKGKGVPPRSGIIKLTTNGNLILLSDGSAFDADGNGIPGGTRIDFIPYRLR